MFKALTKPRVRVVILGGIKYIIHIAIYGKYVHGIQIDFGTPKYLAFENQTERQTALSLLGMGDYSFWQDSQDYQAMIRSLEKETANACQTL